MMVSNVWSEILWRHCAVSEWDELHQIWNRADDRLKQLVLYMQLEKDGRAVESLLNKQDAFLAKVEKPSNIEQCNELIGKYKDLISTMDRNDEKVVQFLKLADDLYSQDNEHSPKAVEKANEIQQRRDTNRDKAEDDLRKLVDSLDWQKLKSDFHSVSEIALNNLAVILIFVGIFTKSGMMTL